MRILLVDDEPMLLLALQRAVRQAQPDWEVVLARSGQEALEQMRLLAFDVVVTDISMPGMDGMTLLEAVRQDPLRADTAVIFMTSLDDRRSMRAGMSAGADDYLTKPFTPDELLAAIRGRLRRRDQVPPIPSAARSSREQLAALLTGRELEVLVRIGRGLGSKEIASDLGISPRTVDVHRTNLMRKLDLHNAASLARLAMSAHLV